MRDAESLLEIVSALKPPLGSVFVRCLWSCNVEVDSFLGFTRHLSGNTNWTDINESSEASGALYSGLLISREDCPHLRKDAPDRNRHLGGLFFEPGLAFGKLFGKFPP